MECKICKRNCRDNRSLGIHIKSMHGMTTQEYYETYIGPQLSCLTCGKPTKFINLTLGFRKHCCNKCAQLDPVTAKAREDGCVKHFGVTNAMKDKYISTNAVNNRVQKIKQLANDNHLIAIPQKDNYMLSRICVANNIQIFKVGQKCFVKNDDYNKLTDLYNFWKNGQSTLELKILDIVQELYSGKIIVNTKQIIGPKELDIYLPELNLAFEVNGNYRHSKDFKDKYYHINKTNLCKDKGIKLIHIFEYEWINDVNNVKNIIKNAICGNIRQEDNLTLDLSKESLLSYPTYNIIKILDPVLINNVYNCGYAIITNNEK